MSQHDSGRPSNRLIHETSPYLLQHAHNPVDWYPWGREALDRSRTERRPILLSIGYSACHWCHVMERESFEDPHIARVMNANFVCVKVDREERPDLDEIYMSATQMLNQGQGGWPMTVFLTPDQEPFFAGTYFPPSDHLGRPGFPSILARIAEMWKSDPKSVRSQAAQLTRMLHQETGVDPGLPVGLGEIDAAAAQLRADFDEENGGFGGAPKFPPAVGLRLLLRHHARTGAARSLEMVRRTLEAMAHGGIYDQIGGGFARYSTDDRWLVPHFEKMLYDNALLVRAYLEAYQVTGDPLMARIVRETCDYVLREMTGPEGGFHSSTDADSEGEEGRFFVWTLAQIQEVLDPDEARAFAEYYDVSVHGNWEGKNVLNVPRSVDQVAAAMGIGAGQLSALLESSRTKIRAARALRVPPGLDDKVLTGWNGLMIGALAEAHRVLDEPRFLEAAEKSAAFLCASLRRPDGRMLRTFRAGSAHLDGYLEDHAYLADALIDLAEAQDGPGAGGERGGAGGADRWLNEALRLGETIVASFGGTAGGDGGFFHTALDHEKLLLRPRTGVDGATPAANAVAAHALARLACHFDRDDLREAAVGAIGAHGRAIASYPRAHAMSLIVADFLLHGPIELTFVGRAGSPDLAELHRAVGRRFLPRRVIAHADPDSPWSAPAPAPAPALASAPTLARSEHEPHPAADPAHPALPRSGRPLLVGKVAKEGKSTLYICRHQECLAPVTDPEAVAAALEGPIRGAPQRRTIGRVVPGHATAEGTVALARRHATGRDKHAYASLGSTDLVVSRLGFGCYRVHEDNPDHLEALREALLEGINLVDTSTNYTDGASERAVGRVLGALVSEGRLRREEIVVVSKIGYIQGENMRLVVERAANGAPYPEVVEYMDGCWHCIHPEFLADQLERSLARLGLETLDVCLLHNPEYFLADSAKRGAESLDDTREEFYERLRDAFAYFESQVAAGKIRAYGVSSNSVADPAGDTETTDLSRILAAAREAGGTAHHFRVLQLPINLLESRALLDSNTGDRGKQTVLELAAAQRVAVLVNRPLNAAVGGGAAMMRLAIPHAPPLPPSGDPVDMDSTMTALAFLEQEFRRIFVPQIQVSGGRIRPDQFFGWSQQLKGVMDHIQNAEHWRDMERGMIRPQLEHVLAALDAAMQDQAGKEWHAWRGRYVPVLERLLAELGRRAVHKGSGPKEAILRGLDPLLPAERRGESLSRKALWVLESTPGVSVVLVGMRHEDYIADALGTLAWPPIADVAPIYRALRPLVTT